VAANEFIIQYFTAFQRALAGQFFGVEQTVDLDLPQLISTRQVETLSSSRFYEL